MEEGIQLMKSASTDHQRCPVSEGREGPEPARKPLCREDPIWDSRLPAVRSEPSPKLGTVPPPYPAFSKPTIPADSGGEWDKIPHIPSPAPPRTVSVCFWKEIIHCTNMCLSDTVLDSDFEE